LFWLRENAVDISFYSQITLRKIKLL